MIMADSRRRAQQQFLRMERLDKFYDGLDKVEDLACTCEAEGTHAEDCVLVKAYKQFKEKEDACEG